MRKIVAHLVVFLCPLLSNFVAAQNICGKKVSSVIGYNNNMTAYHVNAKEAKNLKRIVIYGDIADTVTIYVNDKEIYRQFTKTPVGNVMKRAVDTFIHVNDSLFTYLKVCITGENNHTEFPLDMRYFFVNLYIFLGEDIKY